MISKKCPQGHGLKRRETEMHGDQCDKCKQYQPQYSIMYGCRKCEYDLCEKCAMKEEN